MDENIPDHAPVRVLDRIIDGLDLSDLIATYESGGTSPYHPRMLVKVVFYAYMNNVYSCRKIEKLLQENIHYMWLSGNQYPSYSTINRFRSERLKDCVNALFVQVVLLLVEEGQLTLETQYIDGTKIESVANKYTFVWKKNVLRYKERLEVKISSILAQIDEGIAQDNSPAADEVPNPIDSETLQAKIDQINAANKESMTKAKKKQIKELSTCKEKLASYENHLETLGDRNSYSKTDPSATFMHMKEDAMNNGQTKPGYNLQIATENQYITNFGLFWRPTDTCTYLPLMTLFYARFGKMPTVNCADAGYGSEENYEFMEAHDIQPYVKYNYFHKEQKRKHKENAFIQDNLYYNETEDYYVCPMGQRMYYAGSYTRKSKAGYPSKIHKYKAQRCTGCPLRGQCYKAEGNRVIGVNVQLNKYKKKARELLLSEEGIHHRGRRCIEPEAVFGQMKYDKQYKRFRHRGHDKVQMDFAIFAMAFNIEKLCRKLQKAGGQNPKCSNKTKNHWIWAQMALLYPQTAKSA